MAGSADPEEAWPRSEALFRLARFPIRELIARLEEFAVDAPIERRDALKHAACGFGYLALAGLAGAAPADSARAAAAAFSSESEARHFLVHARRRQPRGFL